MAVRRMKNVTVNFVNGETSVLDAEEIVMFGKDKMTELEKQMHDGNYKKMFGAIQCSPAFLASATCELLKQLKEQCPGLDDIVIAQHLTNDSDSVVSGLSNSLFEMLADILCDDDK